LVCSKAVLVLLMPALAQRNCSPPLLLYRCIYFLLPFGLALMWLAVREVRAARLLAGVVATGAMVAGMGRAQMLQSRCSSRVRCC